MQWHNVFAKTIIQWYVANMFKCLFYRITNFHDIYIYTCTHTNIIL